MPDVSGPADSTPAGRPHLPPTAGLDGLKYRTAAEAALEPESPAAHRVGWGFISLYTLAYMSTCLLFLAPLLVTLALKVNSLVGIDQAPNSLALVAGIGALLAMFGNPFFGKMSDRTSSRLGMRRPWMVIGLVGRFPRHPRRRAGTQHRGRPRRMVHRPAVLQRAARRQVAVLPDQVPVAQRGLVSGVLGVCLPIASVSGTFLVKLFTGNQLAMFLVPCAIGGFFILLFAVTLNDRRLAKADKPAWSLREFASTFYVNPRKSPDFAWAFASRFMFVLAYAFLITYQAYYLLDKIGSAEADVPQQIFLGTLVQSVVVVAASLIGGRLSDRTGRRKIFVLTASIVYGLAMFVIAIASNFNGFLVGMAIGGLGFGIYMAVDLALVVDVLPDKDNAAKDLGVFNIAGALPFSIAPAIAPVILAIGGGSYGVLYAVAGVCAIVGAVAILPVKRSAEDRVRAARQVELPGPADRRPTVVHAELGVDVLGVGPHGVQRHHELAGDVRAVQVGSEQPEHVELAFAQRLDQALTGGRAVLGLANGGQESADVARGDPAFRGRSEQGGHGWALVDEDADVALRLGQRQRASQRRQRSRDVAARLVGERLQHQDLDDAARPAALRPPRAGGAPGAGSPPGRERSARSAVYRARSTLARVMCSNSRR